MRQDSNVLIALDRRAGADQVAVAKNVVDATDGRPVFAVDQGVQRINRLLTAIRVRPLADQLRRMLRQVDGTTVHDQGRQQCGIVTFTVAGVSASTVLTSTISPDTGA